MPDYLAADHAASAARTINTTAVALRIVATLTNRSMPFAPTTAMAATVHNAASAATPTVTHPPAGALFRELCVAPIRRPMSPVALPIPEHDALRRRTT